jgi:Protein kinase domain
VAPEVLRGDQYGSEVDIWSMGVVCYVLLVGYPPFYDEDQRKLFKKIKEGRYHFHADHWGGISPGATDMIRKMLCVNQSERWSARQLLEHSWIVTDDDELLAKDLTRSIIAMRKFKAKMRFKAAAKAIIATKRMMKGMAKSLQPSVKPAANSSYLPAIDIYQKVSHRVVNSLIDSSSHVPHTLPSIRLHTQEQQIEQGHVHGYENAHVKIHTPRPEFSQSDHEGRGIEGEREEGKGGKNEEERRRERDNKMHEKICNDQIHRMKEKEKEREMEKERRKNSERIEDKIMDKKKDKVRGDKDIEKGRERGKDRDRDREGVKLQDIFSDKKVSQFENNILTKESFIQCNRSPVSVSTIMSMSVPESAECSAPGTPRSTIPTLSFPNGKFTPLLPKEENNSASASASVSASECVSVSASVSASDSVLRMETIGNKSPRTN